MSEQKMWVAIRPMFVGLDAVRVENPAHPGTPDVNYVGGWVELKHVAAWPVYDDAELKIRHFTPEQKVWLTRRWLAGGAAHLLLQVRNDWLLFTAPKACEFVGCSTKYSLICNAKQHWTGKPTLLGEFQRWLKRKQ